MYVETVEKQAEPRTVDLDLEVPIVSAPLPPYLAFKETWRNKGRFLLVGFVIALVTTLVLFVDGLAQGLGAGNIELLQKLVRDPAAIKELQAAQAGLADRYHVDRIANEWSELVFVAGGQVD